MALFIILKSASRTALACLILLFMSELISDELMRNIALVMIYAYVIFGMLSDLTDERNHE